MVTSGRRAVAMCCSRRLHSSQLESAPSVDSQASPRLVRSVLARTCATTTSSRCRRNWSMWQCRLRRWPNTSNELTASPSLHGQLSADRSLRSCAAPWTKH
jgi:hypothetical protein